MKKSYLDITLSIAAGVLILSVGAGVWLLPSDDFSEEENRALATLSSPTLASITDGSFSGDISNYLCDRLPFRIEAIRLRALTELLLLKGECNSVLFCRDGYLLDRGEYEDLTKAENKLNELSDLRSALSEAGIPVTVAYIPRGIDVMEEKLPSLYEGSQKDILTVITTDSADTDLTTPLKKAADAGEYVWFKTDHHWTSHGAYIAYSELSSALGYTPYQKDLFTQETVSEDFLGSIYSRAGCVASSPDTVELYRYEGDGEYLLSAEGELLQRGLYFPEHLEKKDKYSVFLGGNYAYLSIKKEADGSRPRLLIIKDSYANALVPFLALHFDIEMIDPRFYSGYEEIYDKVKNTDQALILQGIDTIAT